MQNKGLMTFGTLGAIILGFIAPLIVWFNKDKLNPEEKAIMTSFFNFEISLLIVCIIVSFIPYAGHLVNLALSVVNIVYAILAYLAVKDNKPFKAFTIYEFVK